MNALIETEIQHLPQTYEVNSNEDLVKINAVLKGVKQLKKKVEDELNPEIEKAHTAHKGLTTLKKKYLEPLEKVEKSINEALKRWTVKQEAEAKALQDKINKDLSEKAEALKLEKLKEAEGKDEWAKEVAQEQASEIKADSVDLTVCKEAVMTKQEGQYKRSNWKAKVIDELLVPDRFWVIDLCKLDVEAKQSKSTLCPIAGVEFYDDFTIVTKV